MRVRAKEGERLMNSVGILVEEHRQILRMLDVMHCASLHLLSGSPVDGEDWRGMVAFVRQYADRIHHGKEENYLFKMIVDEMGEVGDNLIRRGMMVEHDIGRLYSSDLDAAITAYEAEPIDENRLSILVAAGSYEKLLRRHIQKENDTVFPFGEKILSKAATAWVEERVHHFEQEQANINERETQLARLRELEKIYIR